MRTVGNRNQQPGTMEVSVDKLVSRMAYEALYGVSCRYAADSVKASA